ncbi:uncharacterized protein edin [Drosophila kikkawai]|uniref:Uncharacterized protein edin n=1 Tax=Drosophila kikkawai TaxID=30033 RepID=A0A6P4I3E2_DROKI|nr:uncharacterized protein LOC108071944 [Drosophila kikkawai]
MSSNKSSILLLVACCLVAFVSAYPQPYPEEYLMDEPAEEYLTTEHAELLLAEPEDFLVAEPEELLVRRARSPEGGSVVLTASKDNQVGREASVQYNHNLYTSRDGRGSIDAYAQASRNFDYNRNNYGGGVQASWRF